MNTDKFSNYDSGQKMSGVMDGRCFHAGSFGAMNIHVVAPGTEIRDGSRSMTVERHQVVTLRNNMWMTPDNYLSLCSDPDVIAVEGSTKARAILLVTIWDSWDDEMLSMFGNHENVIAPVVIDQDFGTEIPNIVHDTVTFEIREKDGGYVIVGTIGDVSMIVKSMKDWPAQDAET